MVEKEYRPACAHCDKEFSAEYRPGEVVDHLVECHREAYSEFGRLIRKNTRQQEVRFVSHETMEALRRADE